MLVLRTNKEFDINQFLNVLNKHTNDQLIKNKMETANSTEFVIEIKVKKGIKIQDLNELGEVEHINSMNWLIVNGENIGQKIPVYIRSINLHWLGICESQCDFFVRPTSSIEIVGNTFENGQLTIRIEASGLSDGSEIVYTIDGNIPTENDAVYEKAIQIFESDLTQAIVVRARTLKDNQLGEDIFTRTFILSSRTENINQRFKLPIFSISIDEDELYNPEKGILDRKSTRLNSSHH